MSCQTSDFHAFTATGGVFAMQLPIGIGAGKGDKKHDQLDEHEHRNEDDEGNVKITSDRVPAQLRTQQRVFAWRAASIHSSDAPTNWKW